MCHGGTDRLHVRDEPYAWTLLHVAARHGRLEVVDLLLRRGLDPNVRERGDDADPMHWGRRPGVARPPTPFPCRDPYPGGDRGPRPNGDSHDPRSDRRYDANAQETVGFKSSNNPAGLFFQIQACSTHSPKSSL